MTNEVTQQLKKTYLFRGLPEEALTAVTKKSVKRRLTTGQVLIRRGDPGDSLFLIHDGWVKIVTEDAGGDELIINKCGPGEIIGEMALLDKAPRSATVVAISDGVVLELHQDAFQELLKQRPDLMLTLFRTFSARLRFSTTYIQKAIDWTQRIGAGDYSMIEGSQPIVQATGADEDKASQLLFEFFKMVKSVKAREDELRDKLEKLSLQIDEARRQKEFEEITGSDFYSSLKAQAQALRARRQDK